MTTVNRRAEFAAKHLRQPTREEAQQLVELEQEDRRQREAERHERELRRAFMATPGATPEQWEKEKTTILATDRAEQSAKNKDAARQAQGRLYRNF
jgi:hypothetical protein